MAAHRKDQLTFLTLPTPLPTYIDSADIHTISLEAKLKLLSSTVPFDEGYKVHAKEILGYVEALSEQSLNGVFELKSDDVQKLPMRLLGPGHEHIGNRNEMKEKEVRGSEGEDDKDKWESFIAASYCWGQPAKVDEEDQNGSQSSLAIRKHALPFSPALYQAFLHQRRSLNEGLWVDAFCIDQTSTAEKQIAVNAMDILYRSARAVIILLDDITVSLREQDFLAEYALEFEACESEGVAAPHFGERPPYIKRHPVLRGFFDKLVNARWFERVWCAHEMRLASGHIFLIRCDDDRGAGVRGGTVLRFTGLFMTHLLGLAAGADISNDRLLPLVEVFAEGVLKQFGQQRTMLSYIRVFIDVWRQDAGGNPAIESPVERRWDANLDKLAIAINTIGLGLSVRRVIDDSAGSEKEGVEKRRLPSATADECCRRFITLALAAGDPTALCSTGPSLCLAGGQSTWMRWPKFADVGLSESWMLKMRKFDVEIDPSPAAAYLGLDMCFLNGQGNGSYLRWASERKLRICRAFKEGCERKKFSAPNHNYSYANLKKAGGEQRKVHIRTLVAIMGCGIEWVKWMGENVLEDWDTELLVKGVQRLVDHENFKTAQDEEKEPFGVSYMDERGGRREAELLLDFSRYLMHHALPWKSEGSMTPYEPVCVVSPAREIDRESGEKRVQTALMYAYVPDGGSIVDVVCAVPNALLHDDYSSLFRGWSMIKGEPQDVEAQGKSKSRYHLLGKSAIYGMVFSSPAQDDEGDARIRRQFGLEVEATRLYGPRDL
jgi:hypothetical protein